MVDEGDHEELRRSDEQVKVGERVTFPPDGVHFTLASERHEMAIQSESKCPCDHSVCRVALATAQTTHPMGEMGEACFAHVVSSRSE